MKSLTMKYANGIVVNKYIPKGAILTDATDQYVISGNAYPDFTMSFITNITLWNKLNNFYAVGLVPWQ